MQRGQIAVIGIANVRVEEDSSGYRRLVATRALQEGEKVFSESPFEVNGVKLSAPNSKTSCFRCHRNRVSERFQCPKCRVFHCSSQCVQFHGDLECQLFARVSWEAVEDDDVALLVLCLRYCAALQPLKHPNERPLAQFCNEFCMEDGPAVGARQRERIGYIQATFSVALAACQPSSENAVLNGFEELAKVVYCNAYYEACVSGGYAASGTALFGTAALLNHSCSPNADVLYALRDSQSANIVVKALRSILPGEEITVNYGVPFWLPTLLRRIKLEKERSFWCHCSRCLSEPDTLLVSARDYRDLSITRCNIESLDADSWHEQFAEMGLLALAKVTECIDSHTELAVPVSESLYSALQSAQDICSILKARVLVSAKASAAFRMESCSLVNAAFDVLLSVRERVETTEWHPVFYFQMAFELVSVFNLYATKSSERSTVLSGRLEGLYLAFSRRVIRFLCDLVELCKYYHTGEAPELAEIHNLVEWLTTGKLVLNVAFPE